MQQVDVPGCRPTELCSPRWRFAEPARVRSLVKNLLQRNPTRTAAVATLSRDDRFALVMQACRPVADLAASDSAMYKRARDALERVLSDLCGSLEPAEKAFRSEVGLPLLRSLVRSAAGVAGGLATARAASSASSTGYHRCPIRMRLYEGGR